MTKSPGAAVELTRDLVRIPSENPPATEQRVAEFVAAWLRRIPGVDVEVYEVRPGRPNVIGRLRADSGAPALAILAHMDTVPVGDGWTKDPFGGVIENGRLYGRGACDMKAGLAAAMLALERAAASTSKRSRDLLVCATVDEEGSHMLGGVDLVSRGIVDRDTYIVATEPTNLEIIVAHKGLVWLEVEAVGKLAHAGNPQFGVDAVRAAAEFITEFHARIAALSHEHGRLGRPTATFSGVQGGIKTNVVPDRARLEIDVRLPPPMTIADVHRIAGQAAEIAERKVPGARVSCRQLNNERPPVEADERSELVGALRRAVERITGRAAVLSGFPAYTDASVIQACTGNRHGLVFGPGALAQAHTVDEYVSLDQVEACAAILVETVTTLCFE
jgi:succinyl-diaminopimelate desuccinylase